MKAYLIRACDNSYEELSMSTRHGVWKWCSQNDVMLVERRIQADSLHPSWGKLDHILDLLRVTDVPVIWCDSDISIINPKHDLSVHYPKNGFSFSSDNWGICAGFFISQGPWSIRFLETVRYLGPTSPFRKHEQDTIKRLVESFGSVSNRVSAFPDVINPDTPFSSQLPFAYHAWAGDCQSRIQDLSTAMIRLSGHWSRSNFEAAKECRIKK